MVTPGEPDAPGGTTLTLQQGEPRLTMQLLSPSSSRWQLIDTATPRHEWDSPNPGTRMVAFEAQAPASGHLRLAVLLTPGSATSKGVDLRPLSDWDHDSTQP